MLPNLITAVQRGQFRWIGGGRHLTSTCHVKNVCEGALLAADRGRPGEIYFLTDGPPVEFRDFVARMLRAVGVEPTDGTVPLGVARALAAVTETVWRLLRLRGTPPVTRMAVGLVGAEVTVSDAKARRELGYAAKVSIEDGLAGMAAG